MVALRAENGGKSGVLRGVFHRRGIAIIYRRINRLQTIPGEVRRPFGQIQVLVLAREWRFESSHPHHLIQRVAEIWVPSVGGRFCVSVRIVCGFSFCVRRALFSWGCFGGSEPPDWLAVYRYGDRSVEQPKADP